MANKGRVLYLLQYLQRCSDEDHPVTTAEIRKELADKGCPATVETARDDISMILGCNCLSINQQSVLCLDGWIYRRYGYCWTS